MTHSETTKELSGAFANLGLIPITQASNLDDMLKAYPGQVAGSLPEGDWNQEKVAFQGLGLLRIVLDTYTDVLYEGEGEGRPLIGFSVDMSKHGGSLKFKDLIDIIHEHIFDHFINPLDNGASIIHSIEGLHDRRGLWLGYDGIEAETDTEGSYYFIKFID